MTTKRYFDNFGEVRLCPNCKLPDRALENYVSWCEHCERLSDLSWPQLLVTAIKNFEDVFLCKL